MDTLDILFPTAAPSLRSASPNPQETRHCFLTDTGLLLATLALDVPDLVSISVHWIVSHPSPIVSLVWATHPLPVCHNPAVDCPQNTDVIVTASTSGTVSIWDANDGLCRAQTTVDDRIHNLVLLDSRLVCIGHSTSIHILDFPSLALIKSVVLDIWILDAVPHTNTAFFLLAKSHGILSLQLSSQNEPTLHVDPAFDPFNQAFLTSINSVRASLRINPFSSTSFLVYSKDKCLVTIDARIYEISTATHLPNDPSYIQDIAFLSQSSVALWTQLGNLILLQNSSIWAILTSNPSESSCIIPLLSHASLLQVTSTSTFSTMTLDLNLLAWTPTHTISNWTSFQNISSIIYLNPNILIIGKTDGSLFKTSLSHVLHHGFDVQPSTTFHGHLASITFLLAIQNNTTLLSSDIHGTICLWNIETGASLGKFLCHNSSILDILPYKSSSTLFLAICDNGALLVLDIQKHDAWNILPPDHNPILSLKWTPKNDILLVERSDTRTHILLNLHLTKTISGTSPSSWTIHHIPNPESTLLHISIPLLTTQDPTLITELNHWCSPQNPSSRIGYLALKTHTTLTAVLDNPWKSSPSHSSKLLLSLQLLHIQPNILSSIQNGLLPNTCPPSLYFFIHTWIDHGFDAVGTMARSLFSTIYSSHDLVSKQKIISCWTNCHPSCPNFHLSYILLGQACIISPNLFTSYLRKEIATYLMDFLPRGSLGQASAIILAHGLAIWKPFLNHDTLFDTFLQAVDSHPEYLHIIHTAMVSLGAEHLAPVFKHILSSSTPSALKRAFSTITYCIEQSPDLGYWHLATLIELTTRALDPSHPDLREALVSPYKNLIYFCLHTYSTLCYHQESQKLAVAHEKGPIIVYDLKTGTRLHLLDGHRFRSTIISFSPNATHLASYSHIENISLFWKINPHILPFLGILSLTPHRTFLVDQTFYTSTSPNNLTYTWKSEDCAELINSINSHHLTFNLSLSSIHG